MDPVFKGCTRPTMLKGAPMEPLMYFCVPIFMIGIIGSAFHPLSLVVAFVLCFSVWVWMRIVSERDEQRLIQLMRLWWHRRQYWATFYLWISRDKLSHHHGLFSYSPIDYRKSAYLSRMLPLGENL